MNTKQRKKYSTKVFEILPDSHEDSINILSEVLGVVICDLGRKLKKEKFEELTKKILNLFYETIILNHK